MKRREKGGERREGGGKEEGGEEEGGEEEGHRGGIGEKERGEEVGKLRKKEANEGWREDK